MRTLPGVDHDDAFRMIDDPCVSRQPAGPVPVGKNRKPPRQAVPLPLDLRGLDPDEPGLNGEDLHDGQKPAKYADFAMLSESRPAEKPDSSFRLDVGCLDDRPPSFRFGLLERTQGFGRWLCERRDLVTEFVETLPPHWFSKNLHHRRIQPGDDILRRVPGNPKSIPERGKEAGKTRLVRRRNIR